MASQRELEGMSAEELGQWMVDKGFGEEARDAFINEGMDGEAVCLAFATISGPDCLRDVIKQFGLRLKVYRAIKDVLANSDQDVTGGSAASQTDSTIVLSENESDEPAVKQKPGYQLLPSTPSMMDDCSSSSSNSPRPAIRKGSNKVPNPFPIPTFRKETEINFKNKRLDDDDRKYVVRTLATMLCTYVQSPSTTDCEVVAKSLVAVHPFLKQPQSWKTFIYTKAQNINRPSSKGKDSTKPAKRTKYIDLSKHPYPSLTLSSDDDTAYERHMKLLKQENAKVKPNMDSVKELMIRTFPRRRKWILDEEHLVVDICQEYPFLRKQTIVASEMDMILGTSESTRDVFTNNWNKWEPAILKYAKSSKNKPAALKHALRDYDGNPEEVTLTALRCAVHFFTTKNRTTKSQKADEMDIPYVLNEKIRGEVIEECCVENQPQIVRYVDADDEISAQYIVAVEKQAFLQYATLLGAVYALFAIHYIFNIEYHPRVKDFYLFIQNKCFCVEDKSTLSAGYSNILTSMECYLDSV